MGFSNQTGHQRAPNRRFVRVLELASGSDSDGSERKGPAVERATAGRDDLPYRVGDIQGGEQRTPERRITLQKGGRVVADTAE